MPTRNAMIAVCSIFLVAGIVAGGVALTHHLKTENDSPPQTQAGLTMLVGSVEPVLASTDLMKNLIKTELEAARDEFSSALQNTIGYEKIDKDRRRAGALRVCNQVLDLAIDELQRSLDRLSALETSKMSELRSWVSSSYPYAEMCIDALSSNSAAESKHGIEIALGSAKERVSNALAMVDHFASAPEPLCTPSIISRPLLPKP